MSGVPRETVAAAPPVSPPAARDEGWPAALRAGGPDRDRAVERLHALLLRAARFEISRRQAALRHVRGEQLDDLAMQAADDALVAVLAKLDQYRGESRFTTWAYKFALLEASVRVRRRAWQDREVVLDPDRWTLLPTPGGAPAEHAERGELLTAIAELVRDDLTPHQRGVLLALAVDGVPIDVLAERLGSTRGALYKTLHDARRKLRSGLAAAGLEI